MGIQSGLAVARDYIETAREGQQYAVLRIPRGTLSQRTPVTLNDP